eukprot:COSAG04_NODE_15664_length_524_cov_1.129412_2_plen_26_part_01
MRHSPGGSALAPQISARVRPLDSAAD